MMRIKFFVVTAMACFIACTSCLPAQQIQRIPDSVPGEVILHVPASEGVFVGAPGIVVIPGGSYVASMNFTSIQGGDLGKVHKTAIYGSQDAGTTWTLLAEIDHQRWSTLFYHRDALYLLGVYEAFGNAVIRKSTDGGKTWSQPGDRENGLIAEGRYHCAPVPVVIHDGRIWRAMEDAPRGREFRAFMMSAPVDSDLMQARSWTFSNKLGFDRSWCDSTMLGWLEGNAVVTPDGHVVDFLRCGFSEGRHGTAAMIRIGPGGREAIFDPSTDFVRFPGAATKFTIRYDSLSARYWSLVNWIQPADEKWLANGDAGSIRNTLALVSSKNLNDWIIERVVLYHPEHRYHAFQYVDWQFERDDIIAVSRTAYDDGMGGADSFHNANFITFHRVRDFRNNFNR